jgi:neural Wiskott-Aldrich syndrome protein
VKKLTKADIGTPSNFKHVTHVGWNAKSGFDLSGEDEALRPFLAKAGVSEKELKNRETREFIYDFIQSNKVTEAVQKERSKPAAPPVPTRNQVSFSLSLLEFFSNLTTFFLQNQNGEREKPAHRVAPPPPPPPKDFTEPQRPQRERQPAPPLPTSTPPVRNTPTRPAPVQQQSTNAPPPPPPPMMVSFVRITNKLLFYKTGTFKFD